MKEEIFMLLPCILLIIIYTFAININYKSKFKIESSIFLSFVIIGLVLYIFGLFNFLNYGFYFILFIFGILLINTTYLIIKRKIKYNEIFTLGSVIFMVVTFILFLITKDANFTIWDEFSHWGPNLKSMLELNALWGSEKFSIIHGNYPPMAGIMEYFICRLDSGFSEGTSYFAINVFSFSFIILVFRGLKFKDTFKSIIFLLILYRLVYSFGFSIYSLYVDLIMSIMLFVGAIIIYNQEELKDKNEGNIIISAVLILLVLTKNIGIIFSAILLLLFFTIEIFIKLLKEKKITNSIKRSLYTFLILIIITAISYFSWSSYTKLNNTVNDMPIKEDISIVIKKFTKSLMISEESDPKYNEITLKYYNALNESVIITGDFVFKTVIQVMVFANIIGIFIYLFFIIEAHEKKKTVYYLLVLNIGLIIFSAFILFLCLFIFTEYEGRILASFERYNATYLLALILSIIGLLVINSNKKNSSPILIIILLLLLTNINLVDLMRPFRKYESSPIPNNISLLANYVKEVVPKNDKVYLICQNNNGISHHYMRYLISPMKTNFWSWSFGEQYYEGDVWTAKITSDQFNNILCKENYNYIIFTNVDNQFIDLYGKMFNVKKIDQLNQKVFKIINMNNCELSFKEI